MRTLVINLTRFGDLLQTQPVFSGLAASGHETGLVCLPNFAPATVLVRDVAAVLPIPGASFLARLDEGWPSALGECLSWVKRVRAEFSPERVLNLTSSLPARLLARAFSRDADPLGFGLDAFGYGTCSSPWASFLEATSQHRGSSPFNLADVFFKAAHLGDGARPFSLASPTPQALAWAQATLGPLVRGHPHCAGLVGMQLGASAAKRQWPVPSFAALANFLWERHNLMPVLLGSKDDQNLAAEFAASAGVAHINLTGATDFAQLGALVSLLRVLITNDTGTMHLAAGLGIPVLAVFLATAQPWDTGPYLAGCCSLEPDMACHPCHFSHVCDVDYACHAAVRPETAMACLEGWLASGRWPGLPGQGARIWESVPGEDGFLDMRSLSGHETSGRAVWNRIQRRALRRFLDAVPPDFSGIDASLLPHSAKQSLTATLSQASGLLEVLLQQARVLESVPHAAMRARFMAGWQRVESLFSSDARLCALGHLWFNAAQGESPDISRFTGFAQRVRELTSSFLQLLAERP